MKHFERIDGDDEPYELEPDNPIYHAAYAILAFVVVAAVLVMYLLSTKGAP